MKRGVMFKSLMLSLTALTLFLCACSEKKAEEPEVTSVFKVGMIYPLSGAAGYVGESGKAAVKIFEEENAGNKYQFEFFWEDSRLNAAERVASAHRLIDVDKVDALITIGSGSASAIAPVAEKGKVLHFAIANTPEASVGDYNFAMATRPDKEAQKLLSEMRDKGLTKAAMVTQTQAFNLAASNEIRKIAPDYGVDLVLDEEVNNGERDFRLLASKIQAVNPQIVIVNLYIPEINIFVKQLKDLLPDVRITGIETLAFPEDKTLLEGYWFVDQSSPQKEFIKRLKEVTGKDDGDFAENVYTSLQLMTESLNENGNDKTKMIEFLQSGKKFDTVLGKVAMDKNGRLESEAGMKIIKNGRVVPYEVN